MEYRPEATIYQLVRVSSYHLVKPTSASKRFAHSKDLYPYRKKANGLRIQRFFLPTTGKQVVLVFRRVCIHIASGFTSNTMNIYAWPFDFTIILDERQSI